MDGLCREILKYLTTSENNTLFFEDFDYPKFFNVTHKDFLIAAGYLSKKGKVYTFKRDGAIIGLILSHESLHRSEFRKIRFLKYLKDNWISILALVIAGISLFRTF